MRSKTLIVLLAVAAFAAVSPQTQAAIVLGTAGNFAILGGSGVINTGSSVINGGDVGSSPTSTVTGFLPGDVNGGTLYTAADPATAQAHVDLIAAYTAAQSAPGGAAGPADLGGASLSPGVYIYAATAPWTAGNLTLDGLSDPNAQWIFQIGTGLTTPAGVTVVLTNGASADHVFWQVGSTATLGAANTFAGNILAQTSITMGGGTLFGRALAIDALVSIPVAETITVPEPATMTLILLGVALLPARRTRIGKGSRER